jgi:hypothetical protein
MKRTWAVFPVLSLALIILAAVLLTQKRAAVDKGPGLLADRAITEIAEIHISNQYDSYSVYQEAGGFVIADLPMELVNAEYLFMLLDEAARVEYLELITQIENLDAQTSPLALYGLEKPLASAVIRYSTGDSVTLNFGAEEPVSGGRYFMTETDGAAGGVVYLMDRSRVVRFLQPLKRFINFEIVPFRNVPSPLSAIKNLTLSGTAFPEPVVITEVRADDEEDMRTAASFGAVTHLIRLPHLHEIDQKEAVKVFDSLSGLLNIEVLDYNCDDQTLAAYGFDNPLVQAEYDFQKDSDSSPVRIILRAARYQDGYILVRDDQRVVHRIENEAFLAASYEKLVSRWFLKPVITDVRAVHINSQGKDFRFELSGADNRSLAVTLNGAAVDTTAFRKLYILLVSASNDGLLLEHPVTAGSPVLGVTFYYRDPLKKSDAMIFSSGSLRRLYVSVNGLTEFACLERYASVVDAALNALASGGDFKTGW